MIKSLLLILLIIGCNLSLSAQEFGRFFTTPEQRQRLEEIKARDGSQIQIGEIDLFVEPESPETEQEVNLDSVKLQGLVYRSSGKNSAWVNDNNTFEGGVGTGYIHIQEDNIDPNNVTVKLPGTDKNIDLKVGDQYEPVTESIISINKNQQ
jgi:hypothetical protein